MKLKSLIAFAVLASVVSCVRVQAQPAEPPAAPHPAEAQRPVTLRDDIAAQCAIEGGCTLYSAARLSALTIQSYQAGLAAGRAASAGDATLPRCSRRMI